MPVLSRARAKAAPSRYGCGQVGELLEPRTTTGTQATTGTVTSVLAAASPGDTILLRAGTYGAITLPGGTSGNPITVKPYDGEAVTISSGGVQVVTAGASYARLAGVRVESTTAQWLSRPGSSASGELVTDSEFRNCTFRGGTDDAIKIIRNCQNFRILGCDIEGGQAHHCVKWDYALSSWFPTGVMTNCLVQKRTIAQGGIFDYSAATEDLIQIEGANNVTLDRITFGEMTTTTAENGLDVKTLLGTSPALLVKRFWLKGPFNGTAEGVNNNTVLQAENDNIVLEDGRVSHGNLEIGGTGPVGATLRRIWVDSGASIVPVLSGDSPRTHGVQLFNITQTGGTLKFGTSTAGNQPHNVELSNSLFTGVNIVKNVGTTFSVCTGNTYTSCTGVVPPCT